MPLLATTEDNPFDPVEQYEEWEQYDTDHGYNTNSLLARIVGPFNTDLPESVLEESMNDAVNWLVEWNPTGNYKKIEI